MQKYAVHGICVSLTSDLPRFLRLVSLNFKAFESQSDTHKCFDVVVRLRKRKWFPGPQAPPEPVGNEEKWGTGIFREGNVARFKSSSISVEFADGEHASVRARYVMDRLTRVAGLYKAVPQWEVCQRLMRLALHQPILRMLEGRGMQLLHAAAVSSNGEAILITGLNGSGKSSLCFSLLDQFDYMADNFTLWDGMEVLGFPEAMRLATTRVDMASSGTPTLWGKRLIPMPPERTVLSARPHTLVVLTQGSRTSITPLSSQEATRRVNQIHDITHEFPRHTYLGTLSQPQDNSQLASLIRSVPAFALTMSDVKEARELVVDLL